MVSFGHSAFFGLGMYGAAAALLGVRPPSLWLAIVAGLVGAGVVAVFVAYFSTRLRDIYFSITTLVFSQIFYVVIFTWTEVTGGENGLTFRQPPFAVPGLFSVAFTCNGLHWFVLAMVTLSYLLLRRVTQSPPRTPRVSSPPVVMSGIGRSVRHQRQHDPEERARAQSAAHVDGAAMVFDDLLGQGQSEARTAFLGREERIEDAIEVRG